MARGAFDGLVMFAHGTGVREMEAVGFCRNKLDDAVRERASDLSPRMPLREVFRQTNAEAFTLELWPEWTKGGYGGTILVPRAIVKRALDWMEIQPTKGRSDRPDPVYASSRGKHYDPQTLGHYFSLSARKAKIKTNFHGLRHGYATRIQRYFSARGQGEMGAQFIQEQLRHRWRETSNRYKHMVEMMDSENAACLAVNAHLSAALEEVSRGT